MLPLSMCSAGQNCLVARIGGNENVKQHLEDLGFVVGTPVQVISASGNGNIIVSVKESRLAITDQMAAKIMVEVADE